jgi:hypothetical protein
VSSPLIQARSTIAGEVAAVAVKGVQVMQGRLLGVVD